jgi:hypothetical protein
MKNTRFEAYFPLLFASSAVGENMRMFNAIF